MHNLFCKSFWSLANLGNDKTFQLNPSIDFPSDGQRISLIQDLIGEGKEDKILVAHDIHTKHRVVKLILKVGSEITLKEIIRE